MKLIQALLLSLLLSWASGGFAQSEPEPQLPPEYVNVNTADAETLELALDGVGPAKAKAIVEHRRENGGFESPEDLTAVRGIGERTIELNLRRIRIED